MDYQAATIVGVLPKHRRDLLSSAVGFAALLLFWFTLSPDAFPGESAALMATRLGIEPRLTPDYPLWFACTTLWSQLPLDVAVYTINLWSAICGALAVGLLCRYMTGWIDTLIVLDDELDERQAGQAAMLAGVFAAFALATSTPFWTAATRAHFLSFHTVLLLLAFNLLHDYRCQGGGWRTYALALLCGVGCAETALFLVMIPFFATLLLVSMYKRDETPWRRMIGLTLTGLIGASLYGVAAWNFAGSEGAELRGYTGSFSVFSQMFLDQLNQLQAMFPSTGWVWIVVTIFVPWLAVQFEARQGLNQRREVVVMLFHVALVVVALLVQRNASFLPWSASLPTGRLPVLELLLTAMVIGYLAAFWFLRFMDPALRVAAEKSGGGNDFSNDDEKFLIRGLAGATGGALILFTVFAALQNGACANGRRAAFADAYVHEILDQLQGRTWLVTDGLLDVQLKITALRRGQTISLINLSEERNLIQIRRLRREIAGTPLFAGRSATFRNAASLGAAAFLQEWLTTDTNAIERLAFYAPPDLLIEAGFQQQADRLLFIATRDTESLKKRPLLEEHETFWKCMDSLLTGATRGDPVNAMRGTLRRHVSMAANNLGVLLEDLGRPAEAYTAYRRSLKIDPDNFSAMLNRVVLTRHDIMTDEKPEAEIDAAKALDKLKQRPDAGRLARYYGYVRVPTEFSRQSSEWMRFGQPKMATAALRRAMELAPEDQKINFLQGLAAIQLADGKPAESEALFQRVLKKTPLDTQALLGMVHLSLMKRDVAAARSWLDEVKLAGVAETTLVIEESTIDIAAGDFEKAQRRLQQVTDADSRNLQAWALQANLLLSQGKAAEVERNILPRMQGAMDKTPHYLIALTQGYTLQAKGPSSYTAARDAFLLALKMNPGTRSVLTEVLKLDYALRDEASTERHAAELLRLDRDDALANYLMGTLLIGRNDLAGAEAHLRRSLATTPSFRVWNDLAETLRMQKKLPEAEEAAREALKLASKSAAAHDTLACVLLDAGRLPEALQACKAARAIAPEALPFTLTEVRILARCGEQVEARLMLRKITPQADKLSPQQRADFDAVVAELKKR